ncbi:hypothetical protein BTM25_04680 [Actinomadura rubteroloni]|uniref:Tat (Twin-arginine translocation) pathway signal sequence n=1 Tax=Actinomadura rubteroloni TaxID=1926885 RepID=A0A2P4UM06_9ACTN|nr:hypothetical protein [Actinomadura rubteroloni]POM26081.1 hypothetical protein BTM25_04680 [Actinomadura rubteroloni]
MFAVPAPSAPVPRRVLGLLGVLAAVLAGAFVVAPGVVAGGEFGSQSDLSAALRAAFTGYWDAGGRDLSPDLERVVDYWFRYHVAKGAFAAMLLIVLLALGRLVWTAYLRADGTGRRGVLATTGLSLGMFAAFALVAVMANVQGAAAPFASLLPMLPDGGHDPRLAGTLDQVRSQLAGAPDGRTPPLDAMVGDFARYHLVMAVIAAVVAVVLLAVGVVLGRAFARSAGRRGRGVLGASGGLSVLAALALVVVAVANTGNAADPAPGLLAFFQGGW